MDSYTQASLGDQVSKKMSEWVLILVAATAIAVFAVSFVQSRQMFLKQVAGWTTIAPRQALTSLIDSDHLSIEREVGFLESTGLFSEFCIKDNQERQLAHFGVNACSSGQLIPIKDEAGIVWGYYSYRTDFMTFILPFVISGIVFLGFISLLFFVIKWRIKSNLGSEFTRFNEFLKNIEVLTEKIHLIYSDENDKALPVVAAYNSEQVIINRAITRLIAEIKKANESLKDAISTAEKKRFQDELTETALQVAHDIGSPLAVLEITVQSSSCALEEQSKIAIRNAAAKIRDIAHSLLKKGEVNMAISSDCHSDRPCNLIGLTNQVVSDKRLEYKDKNNIQINFYYSDDSYGLFAIVNPADFSRIISNIINNAVEALHDKSGEINIKLTDRGDLACLEIEDNGVGIPEDILSKLGERGVTFGKTNGHGLGLYHAKSTVSGWGGMLNIHSRLGHGTVVTIELPKAQFPIWFAPEIAVENQQTVVIADDDESIHLLWKNRFNEIKQTSGCHINLVHLYTTVDLSDWVQAYRSFSGNILYLCDFEFSGSHDNGLAAIDSLDIHQSSILVTSRYYQEDIMQKCIQNDIKLLPKDMAWIIPIKIVS